MTARVPPLAALAVVFAPARAEALLARLAEPDAGDARRAAAALAGAPRRDRLRTLAAALAADADELHRRCEAAAAAERERVAACVRAVATGDPVARVSPALLRLCREATGR